MPEGHREIWVTDAEVSSHLSSVCVYRLGGDGRPTDVVAVVRGRDRKEAAARARLIAQVPGLLACARSQADAADNWLAGFDEAGIDADPELLALRQGSDDARRVLARAGESVRCPWCRTEATAWACEGKSWCGECLHRVDTAPANCDCPACSPGPKAAAGA